MHTQVPVNVMVAAKWVTAVVSIATAVTLCWVIPVR